QRYAVGYSLSSGPGVLDVLSKNNVSENIVSCGNRVFRTVPPACSSPRRPSCYERLFEPRLQDDDCCRQYRYDRGPTARGIRPRLQPVLWLGCVSDPDDALERG